MAGDGGATDEITGSSAIWTGAEAYGTGKVGQAFSVGTGTVSLPFQQIGPFTLQAWVRTPERLQPEFTGLLATGAAGPMATSLQLELDGNGNYRLQLGANETSWLIGPATDFFQHAAVTFDGTTMAAYLNGRLVQSDTWIGSSGLGFDVLTVGMDRDGTHPFTGLVDEVQVFNRALTATEVLETLLAGASGLYKNQPATPVATAAPNPAEATGPTGATVTLDGTGSSDPEHDPLTYSWHEGTTLLGTGPTLSVPLALGSHAITLAVQDDHHHTTLTIVPVLVQDTTPPALSNTPLDLTVEATSAAGAVVTWPLPTAIDIVDAEISIECTPAPGTPFPFDATVVTCSATDAHNNTAHVTVHDTTGPTLVLPRPVVEATGPLGAIVPYMVSATDAVSGAAVVTCAPLAGSVFSLGVTVVRCSATDAAENETRGDFPVAVVDTTGPTARITTPSPDVLVSTPSVNLLLETSDVVGVTDVVVNGIAATRTGGTPQAGTWRVTLPVSLPVAPGGVLRFEARAADAAGHGDAATLLVDNDGIPTPLDRRRTDVADLSGIFSDDFNNGITAGTVTRNGWTARLSTAPTLPSGVRATVAGAGGLMRISACTGTAKEIRLDVTGETADFTCDSATGRVTVRVLSGAPVVDVLKQLSNNTWTRAQVPTGQTYSTGSPATAGAENVAPIDVAIVTMSGRGNERVIGSFQLAPGDSVDVTAAAEGLDEQLQFRALRGVIAVRMNGVTRTVRPGAPAMMRIDHSRIQ